jgi:hypothetical protein
MHRIGMFSGKDSGQTKLEVEISLPMVLLLLRTADAAAAACCVEAALIVRA